MGKEQFLKAAKKSDLTYLSNQSKDSTGLVNVLKVKPEAIRKTVQSLQKVFYFSKFLKSG